MKASDPALSDLFPAAGWEHRDRERDGDVVEDKGQEEEGKNGDANRPDQLKSRTDGEQSQIHTYTL